MPAADYELLQFVGQAEITLSNAVVVGLLTSVQANSGAGLRPVVYFKKLSVFSTPTRMLTHTPVFTSGVLHMQGIFTSDADLGDVIDELSSTYIPEIVLTYTETGATEHPQYYRHCMCRMWGMKSVSMAGVSVLHGSLAYAFGHAVNENNSNYSSSTHDLALAW